MNEIRDLDGITDDVTFYSYDADGNLIREARDVSADGSLDNVSDYTYDANGNELSYTIDLGGDGNPDRIEIRTYDNNNCRATRFSDLDGDGAELRFVTFVRDADCRVLSSEWDRGNDGTVENTSTYDYQDRDNWTISVDSGNDGTIDEEVVSSVARSPDGSWIRTETFRNLSDDMVTRISQEGYDSRGNQTLSFEDIGADGDIEVEVTASHTYRSDGLLSRTTISSREFRTTIFVDLSVEYFYDPDGVLVSEEWDTADNGTVDERFTLTYGPGNWFSFFQMAPPSLF